MRLFRRSKPQVPDIVHKVKPDPASAADDLSKAVSFRLDAQAQSDHADEAVNRLVQSRIRNGFAPAIEESIIRKYLGGAT